MGSEVEVEGAEVEGARQAAPEELVGLPPSQRGQETSVTSAFECSSSGTDLPLHTTWRPKAMDYLTLLKALSPLISFYSSGNSLWS